MTRISIRGRTDASAALYRLMAWLSPAYPVGAFSYSSGLEWAVEAGDVTSAETLHGWLAAPSSDGAGFCDAVFFAHAYRACAARDDAALAEVAELGRRLRTLARAVPRNHRTRSRLPRGAYRGPEKCPPDLKARSAPGRLCPRSDTKRPRPTGPSVRIAVN